MSATRSRTGSGRGGSASGGLALRGPAIAAVVAIAVISGLGVGLAHVEIDPGFSTVSVRAVDRKMEVVRHTGGVISKVYVSAGQTISAGDLMATIDAGDIDLRIAVLKAQSEAAQLQLSALRRETQAFQTLADQELMPRAKVQALEAQVAALERDASGVLTRIAEAERRLKQVEIRSPVAGMVDGAAGLVAGKTIAAGEALAVILLDPGKVVLEGQLPADYALTVAPGSQMKVWIDAIGRPMTAKLTWIGPEPATAAPGRPALCAIRLELDTYDGRLDGRGMVALSGTMTFVSQDSRRTLMQQLLDPIRRIAGRNPIV